MVNSWGKHLKNARPAVRFGCTLCILCEAREQTNVIAPYVVERNNVYDDLDCLEIQKKFVIYNSVHHALLHVQITLCANSDKQR